MGKVTVYRFYTPQHYNKFILQILSYLFFSFQVIVNGFLYRSQYDSIYATSSRLGTALLGYLISKFNQAYLFLDIRDIFSDNLNSINLFKTSIGNKIISIIMKIENLIFSSSNWLNFVSPGFLTYEHLLNNNKKIHIFTNGIDNLFIENRKKIKNKKINKQINSPLQIIYAGNIGYGQGLEFTLIPISEYFKNKIIIKLIGDGSSVLKLKEIIKLKNLKNIIILDPVSRNDLINFYNDADILFLQLNDIPAFRNVLPSKIFDQGSFDKPILAGVSGIAKNFLRKELPHSLIFKPGDYLKAIDYINDILYNKLVDIDNSSFVKKFERKEIMNKMLNSMKHYYKLERDK